ncbi:MAG: AbrB/MazE/SpoVT family DNA-binding domain-containing protein [Calditrichaeota bacterium]|nr:AbrB/MazE/SpoVT family DNA-binding domain-containing protein [Calditrichota bacterium]
MRVTGKGQVTIPKHIRDLLGLMRESEVEFIVEHGKVYISKEKKNNKSKRFRKYRGTATVKMSTDEIMALTRGEK